jgi:hypothetical protein
MAAVKLDRASAELGKLPKLCICCGETATHKKECWLSYVHDGGLTGLVLDHVTGWMWSQALNFEKIKVCLPLCNQHHKPFIWQATAPGWWLTLYFVNAGLLLCLLDRLASDTFETWAPYFLGLAVIGLVGWYLMMRRTSGRALQVTELTTTTITLDGVCPQFAQSARLPRKKFREDPDDPFNFD